MPDLIFTIRPYQNCDRPDVRQIYGTDEFARPQLMQKYPRMSLYLADSMSHYYDIEPHSTFVAEVETRVIGALLGTLDTEKSDQVFRKHIRPLLVKRTLLGKYGWPGFLLSILKTHLAWLKINAPRVDLGQYPAHLHIGLLPDWRRQGVGTALMSEFERYLQQQNVPGYHLYASSFHPMGVAFYRKLGLTEMGNFQWRFHNGVKWLDVTEIIFGKSLRPVSDTPNNLAPEVHTATK